MPQTSPTTIAWRSAVVVLILTAPAAAAGNHYDVTISGGATQNMTFADGVYSATADNAVLNVDDLENALAAGNVEVTTGNGATGDETGDLNIETGVTWNGGNGLTLDAFHSLDFQQSVEDSGTGALSLNVNNGGKGGTLGFMPGMSVVIANLSDVLKINRKAYILGNDVHTLAAAMASNPSGFFALANSYNARRDKVYTAAPIPEFMGVFNGLGNTISNLSIVDRTEGNSVGLFAELDGAKISNFELEAENIKAGLGAIIGGLVAQSNTTEIINTRVTGTIGGFSKECCGAAGGLVGYNNDGVVDKSSAAAIVVSVGQSTGGLVGYNTGKITQSWGAGRVRIAQYAQDEGGGGSLVGQNAGTISDSYATGKVTGTADSTIGGLVGFNDARSPIEQSYSTGYVSDPGGYAGGLIGIDDSDGYVSNCYWDTTTSGTDDGIGHGNEAGITGLTTAQLQAGLPDGFKPTVWAENPDINGGLPYLISNPPQ